MNHRLLPIFLILSFMGIGCTLKNSNPEESILLRSYRLIDEQRDEEAIILLQGALERDSKNREYRMALASAYAHLAGLRIQTLIPLFVSIENLSKAFAGDSHMSQSEQVSSAVTSLMGLMHQFSGILAAYSSIPELAPDKVIFVEQALNEIAFLGKLEQNEAIYSGILRIVLIKNKINTELLGQFTDQNPNQCEIDLDGMNQTVLSLGRKIIAALNDIATANPDQSAQISQWIRKTGAMVSDVSLGVAGAMILDEVSNVAVKNSIIEEGFLKILKCGMPR